MESSNLKIDLDFSNTTINKLKNGIATVIKGKENFIELLLSSLIANGHILLEDLPGLGKTTAAKALAALISKDETEFPLFNRIQFTPDLLPYDITGVDIFDPKENSFTFRRGPVFTTILLADEINRATPKVQSALLEAMGEGQVTIGLTTYKLEKLFFVIATQNPLDMEGTYPLPMAQLDRFLMKLKVGYPDSNFEKEIVMLEPARTMLKKLTPVCSVADISNLQEMANQVYCDEKLIDIAVRICQNTRKIPVVEYGISPRGCIMLIRAARAFALIKGRDYVVEQDIVDISIPVLAHRLKLRDLQFNSENIIREATVASIK
ncbi:MAG: AAA family ATPase [Spirochaetales bacterium]|nr:AAA family ATPase [Spirochaetales bacterium]